MSRPRERILDEPPIPGGLPLAEWRDTHDTLHMWLQIVGKTRLALMPMENHWWHVALYVTARGLTTTPIPYGARTFEVAFDFIGHRLVVATSEGATREIALRPLAVAEFYREYMDVLAALDITVKLWPVPVETDHTIPFPDDRVHGSYDAGHVRRFFAMLAQADRIMKRFKGRFLGKSSPVHFFWGSFDLAVTRFSGRAAPAFQGNVPGLAIDVMREAYSHEVSSAGFWPGGNGVDYPCFYSYQYPVVEPFKHATVQPSEAFFSEQLGEFLLPYDAVRTSSDPDAALLAFLSSTYEAAAIASKWERAAVERPLGKPRVPLP